MLFLLFIFLSCIMAHAELVPLKNAKLVEVRFESTPEMKARFQSYFTESIRQPWDVLKFKIKIDQIIKELFGNGYFTSQVKTELIGTESDVIAKVSISANERVSFYFHGYKVFSQQELRKELIEKIKNDFGKMDKKTLGGFIVDVYETAGFYNTLINSYQNEGHDLDGVAVKNYFFEINEGKKRKIENVLYHGNIAIPSHDLNNLFNKNASSLALAGYYDKNFFEKYSEIINKEYLAKGFVFAEVSKHRIITNDDGTLTIEFGINEKQQVVLKNIILNKLDGNQQALVKEMLINKEGSPLNVVELEIDLKKIISYFQSNGFYFTSISNLNSEKLLVYDKSYSSVEFQPEIILDKQVCFNEALISGNTKTLLQVILREIDIKKGEIITPLKLESLRQKLSGLGLFSSLRISPYMIPGGDDKACAQTNIVIQVKEKDFGLFEIAPGYRTDLGAKLSTGVTYNNFMGMNRSASVKVQANQRFNIDGFDDKRKQENKKSLEYQGKVSLVEPYLLNNFIKTQLELELVSSFQRKRFYGFDADIFRFSPQLSKNITKNLSSSVKYQFERINQFDATVQKDNDNFSIGGITPAVTFDKRNDPINPKQGYYINLSSEWANKYFGSMKNDDLEVNYIKFINRNKFYYPVSDFTLAFSFAIGYEKNYSSEILKDSKGTVLLNSNNVPRTLGYIPSIKVFRLDGYDEVRGFDDSEINHLKSGVPIGDVVVQNEAYFTAFKFEPRYNISDTIQVGIFFDAGRIFVNNFDPLDLRTSIGAGVKFLTPVGSLDFDYGIKLQKRTYLDNRRDVNGRFHLSIGSF